MRKKMVTGFLVLCMLLLAFPVNALAATTDLTVGQLEGLDEGGEGVYVDVASTNMLKVYDLLTKFSITWNQLELKGYFTWSTDTGFSGGGPGLTDGGIIDLSELSLNFPAGEHTFTFYTHSLWPDPPFAGGSDVAYVKINIRRAKATVEVNGPYGTINPDTLSAGHVNDETGDESSTKISWTLTGPGGFSLSGTSQAELDGLLAKGPDGRYLNPSLVEGDYTLSNTATVTTDYGNDVNDTESTNFKIRYPLTTTTVDKNESPTSITGTQTIPDSTLTWVINDSNGETVARGSGANVPPTAFEDLPAGSYTVEFTETSPENLTHTSSGAFIIPTAVASQAPSSQQPGASSQGDAAVVVPSSSAGSSSQSTASSARNTGTSRVAGNTPATGDGANFALIFALMGGSLVAIVAIVAVLIRRRRQAGKNKN